MNPPDLIPRQEGTPLALALDLDLDLDLDLACVSHPYPRHACHTPTVQCP